MNELYARPELYDSLFADYTDDWTFVLSHVQKTGFSPGAHICELACGGGRVIGNLASSSELKDPSRVFSGVDLSPAMLEFAGQRWKSAADVRWHSGDILKRNLGTSETLPPADVVLLMANSLGHFILPAERKSIYRNMADATARRGWGIIAVLIQESFADSASSAVEVGCAVDRSGMRYDVFEQSRILDSDRQEVDWYFVCENPELDFSNRFALARFEKGQVAREMHESGLNVVEQYDGFSQGESFWDICVYRNG